MHDINGGRSTSCAPDGSHTSVVPIPPQGIANWLYMLFSKLAVGITSEFILLCTNTL